MSVVYIDEDMVKTVEALAKKLGGFKGKRMKNYGEIEFEGAVRSMETFLRNLDNGVYKYDD
ncbi:TPA_asm: capsid portal protein [Altiarchaeum virus]|nr:TPA_asm: capsid portal protein [Altiarchaeum virus]